ncbi:hypothetical protein K645_2416 [Blattabacterium sp. (Nauphoeta cinerea)]|uniref:hypothetical protein n=1 Tax=Blattabacterium sp. (Nauphoeta cinerea) TaxID=1316444 RepID=UPI0003B0EA8E|nr:hypothetical protein K645_2416 [Blattabacterium sp. (Nauphoeta cinerea)]
MRASFFSNKSILEKMHKNVYIIFIYKSFYFPEFKNINESIINIFNKITKNHY